MVVTGAGGGLGKMYVNLMSKTQSLYEFLFIFLVVMQSSSLREELTLW